MIDGNEKTLLPPVNSINTLADAGDIFFICGVITITTRVEAQDMLVWVLRLDM